MPQSLVRRLACNGVIKVAVAGICLRMAGECLEKAMQFLGVIGGSNGFQWQVFRGWVTGILVVLR